MYRDILFQPFYISYKRQESMEQFHMAPELQNAP